MKTVGTTIRTLGAAALLALSACGGDGGSSAPPAEDTSATVTAPISPQAGYVTLNYRLVDGNGEALSIVVQFSTNGGTSWTTATQGAGSDGLLNLSSSPSPGTAHVFVWNSLADAPANVNARLRITASDATAGGAAATADFAVNNAGNTAPSVALGSVFEAMALVVIAYDLTDPDGNTCSMTLQYSIDGGTNYLDCTKGPGHEGLSGLASSPGGTTHRFIWNSFADGVGLVAPQAASFRLQASDGAAGVAITTSTYTIDNTTRYSGASVGLAWPEVVDQVALGADEPEAMVTDGAYLYVVGHDMGNGTPNESMWFIEKRHLHDGNYDTGFDGDSGTGNGLIVSNPGAGGDRSSSIALDGDYLWVAGYLEIGDLMNSPTDRAWRLEKRRKSDGTLVTAFNTTGFLETGSMGDGLGPRVLVDGTHVYLLGIAEGSPGSGDMFSRILKLDKTTGAPDTAFDGDGTLDINVNSLVDGMGGFIDGSHLILVGVYDLDFSNLATSNSKLRFECRKLSDGTLDTAAGFGTGGVITQDPTPGNDIALSAVRVGASFYVFLNEQISTPPFVEGWRFQKRSVATGALQLAVQSPATVESDFFTVTGGLSTDGTHLYCAGTVGTVPDWKWRIEKRLLTDLSLVTTFGTNGVELIDPTPGGGPEEGCSGIVCDTGILYVFGSDRSTGNGRWRIDARLR